MKTQLLLASLILALYSCQPHEEGKKIISRVPESGTLVSKEVALSNAALMPYKIVVSADKAVILDQGKENLFKVYNLPDLSFLYAFGDIGEGPDEFQFVNGNSLKIHGEHLVVLSGARLIKIKLHAEKATWEEQFKLITDSGGPINGLHLINDSVYVADLWDAKPGAPEHRLVHLGRKEELARFGEFPEPTSGENREQGNLVRDYMKATVANPKDGRLAAFYLYHNQIRLYSKDGELLQEIEVKSSSKSASDEEMWIYRAEPFATSDHIYVLYVGMPKKDVEENFQRFRPNLEVWDWEGNLLARFRLDQPVTAFTYAEKFKKLYGLSFFKEDVLFEYDLKEGVIAGYEKGPSPGTDKNAEKHGQTVSSDKNIIAENDYYRMELPTGWNYPPSWTLEEKKSLYERDGLYHTGGTFIRENPPNKSFCGASMRISVYIAKESDFNFDGFISSRVDRYRSGDKLGNLDISELGDGRKGFMVNFTNRAVDPKGKEHLAKNQIAIFEREGKIIETAYTGCELYEKYYDAVQTAFSTLTLRPIN